VSWTGALLHPMALQPRPLGENKPMVSHANPYLERGLAFKVEGRYEEAISEFQRLLAEDPNSSDGHYQLGLVYGFTGMFDESIEELQHGGDPWLRPASKFAWNLALTYTMLGCTRKPNWSSGKSCAAIPTTSARWRA